MKGLLFKIKRAFTYAQYDSSVYWRQRAQGSGESRVMWKNEDYNQLYRKIQRKVISSFIKGLDKGSIILDIGCGIGTVSKMIIDLNPHLRVDGVDFPEMIQIARLENSSTRINYIANSAEEYFDPSRHYKLVISSGCFSAVRDVKRMERGIMNCIRMLDGSGLFLIMDPFHRWNYLARVKYSSRQLINLMEREGLSLVYKSGALFWPYRDWLANSSYRGADLEKKFTQGERLLSLLGRHFWADYKILAFRKK
jgi:2-polyprenyl-3-methyl-5-hydroxy-6-metoxy-1,4-benzoquinol methylase